MVSKPTRLAVQRRTSQSVLPLLAIALSACGAAATPMVFVEAFDGPGLDRVAMQQHVADSVLQRLVEVLDQ